MIISYSKNFIFMKTRKTAGSSVQAFLSKYCDYGQDIITGDYVDETGVHEEYHAGVNISLFGDDHPHPPMWQVYHYITSKEGKDAWDRFLSFAIVRNPFDLVVSRYHWDMKYKKGNPDTSIEGFREWVKNKNVPHFDIQNQYTHYEGNFMVTTVVKYENLDEDLKNIFWVLNIKENMNFTLKSGYRSEKDYTKFYDPESKDIVESIFEKDLKVYGYKF